VNRKRKKTPLTETPVSPLTETKTDNKSQLSYQEKNVLFGQKRQMQALINEIVKIPVESRPPQKLYDFLSQAQWRLEVADRWYVMKFCMAHRMFSELLEDSFEQDDAPVLPPPWAKITGPLYFPSAQVMFHTSAAVKAFFF